MRSSAAARNVVEFPAAREAPHYADAGPGTLSLQPPFLDEPPRQVDDWPTLLEHCEQKINIEKQWRYSWWQHWAILARYQFPYRYHWVITANTYNRGFPVNDAIINETPILCRRICASGLMEGLMSPSRPWARLDPAVTNFDVDAAGRRWLDDTMDRTFAILAGSNWYAACSQMFDDETCFGTSPNIILEDHADVIRCYVPCAGEYFCVAGGRLSVDGLDREFTYTTQQIVDFFGLENCPEDVRTLWLEGPAGQNREFVIGHVIEPNFDLSIRGAQRRLRVVPHHFPYREVYWLKGRSTPAPLLVRGFTEKPFMVMRWSATSNDPYGRGPGMDALGGSRQLQTQEMRFGEYVDKIVRPPMIGDVSLENKPSSIRSGEITYVNAQDGKQQFYPAFEVNPQGLQPMRESIERVEQRAGRIYYNDVFLMISQMEGIQPRNELELNQRIGEKIQQLGPMIELAEGEISSGLARVMAICNRRGLYRPMPRSLRGVPIGITYTSIMKVAQRAAATATMERVWAVGGNLSQAAQAAGLPNPLKVLNLDESYRIYADRMNYPARGLFSEQEVAENDRAAAQANAEQQAMQATLPAVQAAQGLSKIPVGAGVSALDAMLGTGGGTGG